MNATSQPHRFHRLLVLGFALFSLVVGVLGYLLYRIQAADIRTNEARELSTIADLKLGELINWRRERESDAFVILENQPTARRFSEFLDKPSRASLKRELVEWMDSWRKNYNYGSVLFLNQRGALHLSAPPRVTHISPATRDLAIEAALTRKVIFSDLCKDEITDETCLDLLVPLLVPQARDTLCTGIIVLRINPHQFLYPFIQSWPTPSRTGETLLLRREGNDVVYLNELRHRKNTALSLRLPLTDEYLPAAMGARGRRGIAEGFDYRGIPVLASIQEVPNSSWFLVAKVDLEESYEPVWTRLAFIGGIIGLIILAGGITTAFIWRSRSAHLYRGLYESEKQRSALVEHYSYLTKYANDIILLMTAEGRIVEANDRAVIAYGYERDELLQLNISNLRAPETVAFLERDLRDVRERNGKVFETLHRRKDGSVFPVEVSSRVITIEESGFYQHIIRDITERKRAEKHISRVNRLYAVLGQINQMIVRTRDRNTLFEEICRVAVEIGKFRMAWIGFVETDGKTVRPIVSRGVVDGYLTDIRIVAADEPERRGPTGSAIREAKIIICNDVASDSRMKPWREQMLQRGYRSCAALPIRLEGRVVGALNVYVDEVDFFDRGEIQLLEEIAGDITFALGAIEQEEKRKRAEEELQKSEARLKEAQRLGRIGHWEFDVQTAQIRWSDMVYALYERDPKLGPPTVEEEAAYYCPEDAERLRNCAQRSIETGEPYIIDVRVKLPGGRSMDAVAIGTPVKDAHGRVIRLLGTIQDITERKRAEKQIALLAHSVKSIIECVSITDMNDTLLFVNEAFLTTYGYDEHELLGKNIEIVRSPNNPPEVVREIRDATLGAGWHGELLNRTKDGREFPVSLSTSSVRDDTGQAVALVGVATDITERKKAEEALRNSEEKLRLVFENAYDGISIFEESPDPNQRKLVDCNLRYAEMAGRTWEELIKIGNTLELARTLSEDNSQSIEQGVAFRGSFSWIRPDGKDNIIEYTAVPIKMQGKTYTIGIDRDITERKRAEAALANERNLLRTLIDNMPDRIYAKDTEGRFIICNKSLAIRMGMANPDEIVGKSDFDFLPQELAAQFRADEQEIIRSGQSLINREEPMDSLSGETRWSLATKVPLRDNQGTVIGIVGMGRDITERKRAEEKLRLSDEIIKRVNSLILIADTNGRITYASPSVKTILGYETAEVLGDGWWLSTREDCREQEEARMQVARAARRETPITEGPYETKLRSKDGETHWILWQDARGVHQELIGVGQDITERKRAEEALTQERSLLRALMDNVPDHIYFKDTDSHFLRINKAQAEIFGLSDPAQAVGKTDFDFFTEEHARPTYEDEQEIIRTGQPLVGLEEKETWPDGRETWVSTTKVPLRDIKGQVIGTFGISRDITERKQAEKALRDEKALMDALMDNIPDSIYFKDRQCHLVRINRKMMQSLNLDEMSQAIGKTDVELFNEEFGRKTLASDQKLMESGEPIIGLVETRQLEDGQTNWTLTTKVPLRDASGQIMGLVGITREINELMRTQEALRDNEQRLTVALTCADIAVFNQDKDLRYTWMFNPQLGFLPEEIIGKTDRELFSRADLSRVLETKQKVLESGIGASEEVLITLNQQEISVLLSVEPLRDSSGTIVGLTGAMIDITERKLSQQRLEQERNLLRTLIEAIPDEIAVKDVERRFVLVNPACVRALKKESAEDVVGKRDEDLIPEKHARDGMLEDERVLATGKQFVDEEGKTRINPKTGAIERSILISKIPLRDRDGKITGLVAVNRDITERKRAEVEIQRSRDWLNAILDASRDGIVAERNETIVYANAPYARIYGYDDPAELTGKHVSTVQSELDNTRMLQFGRRRLDGERMPEVYEFKGRKKDGRFIDLEASVSTASIAGEEHIVATVRDITERKSLQKQLIEAQKMESIGTLAGGIAHDFNNILGIIMGHSSILEQTRENPEKFSQSAQAISKATLRGAGLVRQLLTFARKTDVTMQSVSINDTLNELAKLLAETLPKTIVMELNLEKKLPSILADPTQLHQVFLNLCVNARDAMMPKGGRLSLTTRLVSGEAVIAKFRRADAMEHIVVDVADSGIGMDEATRSRIFEPFFTTKEIGKGTGLGLATVYGIVESHRGFIDVESRVGVGSTFHVYLPVEPRHVKRGELEKAAEKEIPGGTETILVVEDEETLRDLVSFVLEGKGYRVLKASDGEEGLRLFTERMQEIALVLSDLGLPKISGEDLLKKVQQLKPGARVILASGYVEPETKSELLKAGAVEIVQKPYVPVEILKKIREALDSAV